MTGASLASQRALAVADLLDQHGPDGVCVGDVQAELGLGRNQAKKAIRQARHIVAQRGPAGISYSTPKNNYRTAVNGDSRQRGQSVVTQVNHVLTRIKNLKEITGASLAYEGANAEEQELALLIQVIEAQAQLNRHQVNRIADRLNGQGNLTV